LTPHGLYPPPGLCSRSMRRLCQSPLRNRLKRLVNRMSLVLHSLA
jgi:hypothetical protein